MKKVLVVYFSQTDQLTNVVKSIGKPLKDEETIQLTVERLVPQTPYAFPWPFFRFLDQFPESVYLDPPPLQPLSVDKNEAYDLIILAYQVWFLSPSLPITSFMQSEEGKQLLAGKPVVTVIACRNMWLMAQEKMKELITLAGARLLDNVALVDQGSSLATFITTPRWMLTGNRGSGQGLFPKAGINEEQISQATRFGDALVTALDHDDEQGDKPLLQGLGAVEVNTRLIPSEKIANRSFMIWGKLLRAIGPPGSMARRPVLIIYLIFLITLIVTIVPLTMLLRTLLRPFMKHKIAQQKHYFEQPSGSDTSKIT